MVVLKSAHAEPDAVAVAAQEDVWAPVCSSIRHVDDVVSQMPTAGRVTTDDMVSESEWQVCYSDTDQGSHNALVEMANAVAM